MMQLSREIRFALVDAQAQNVTNSWAGWPSTNRIVPHLRLQSIVQGHANKQTGYICNIKELDDMLRSAIAQSSIFEVASTLTAETLVRLIYEHCQNCWKSDTKIVRQSLHVTPYLSYHIESREPSMTHLTQQFEFSASHRLHCNDLSEDENRAVFGKCNNPAGHGHNYIFEVTVAGDVNDFGQIIELHQFEAIVKKLVVDRLDHKHLNSDVEYFVDVNPSVENITNAIWHWLDGELPDVTLQSVKVFETPKTWAEKKRRYD